MISKNYGSCYFEKPQFFLHSAPAHLPSEIPVQNSTGPLNSLDLTPRGDNYIVIAIDRFTHRPELVPIPETCACAS